MTTYLSMNGVGDYLKLPSLTFTEIWLDVKPYQDARSSQYWFDSRTGSDFYMYSTSTVEYYSGTNIDGVYVNDVKKTNNARMVTSGTRVTIKFKKTVAATDDINIVSRNDAIANQMLKADIWDIKIYNGATLVAHYDMSTGNVNDQTGNGHNATLTGGTWLDDGTGGGTTTYVGTGSTNATSSLTTPDKEIMKGGNATQGFSNLTTTEDFIMVAMGGLQGLSSLTSGESIIVHTGSTYSGSGDIVGTSILTANELKKFIANGSILVIPVLNDVNKIILSDHSTVNGLSILNSIDILHQPSLPQWYYDSGSVQAKSYLFTKEVITHFTIPLFNVATIELKGQQKINVYLIGSQTNEIYLKGRE